MNHAKYVKYAGEPFIQFARGRWWFGTPPHGWPYIKRQRYGNQLYTWSLWMRLPGDRELRFNGKKLAGPEYY